MGLLEEGAETISNSTRRREERLIALLYADLVLVYLLFCDPVLV